MSDLIARFTLLHSLGEFSCNLTFYSGGCLPTRGPFYFDNELLNFPYTVQKDCCSLSVRDFDVISGSFDSQRLSQLRLRYADFPLTTSPTNSSYFECMHGNCTFYRAPDDTTESSDLITFSLIIFFFCCWVQWSLHLTDYINLILGSSKDKNVFDENQKKNVGVACLPKEEEETVFQKLSHYNNLLKSFSIIVLDVIWYVAWDKIDTLTSDPQFYDDNLEDLIGSYNVKYYCQGIQHVTLILGILLTFLVCSLQDSLAVDEDQGGFLNSIKNGIKRAFNWFLGVSQTFFGNRDDKPKVQLLIRWLLEVLLLNAAYISVPWRLGQGIKEVIGFGAGCTIAFITGRDGTMLQKRFDLLRQQQLGLLLTYAVFVVHAALFLLFPLFATTQTLLDRHAFVIALSLSVQVFCIGKLYS